MNQRVLVDIKDFRTSPGKALPVRDFRIILNMVGSSDEAINKYLSICVLFLAIPTSVTPLFLPYEEVTPVDNPLNVLGFGSTWPNERDTYGILKTAIFYKVELGKCLNEYRQLLVNKEIKPSFEYLCREGRFKARTSFFDNGAPLLDMDSSIIYGTAVSIFPNYQAQDEKQGIVQVFISLLPLTKDISKAIDQMNFNARD